MKFHFFLMRKASLLVRAAAVLLFVATIAFIPALSTAAQTMAASSVQMQPSGTQQASNAEMEFRRLAADILTRRLNGNEETRTEQEAPLQILDLIVLESLNSPGDPKLDELNQRLAALVAQDSAAAGRYSVQQLGGSPAIYALAANFGASGPSAARIYARGIEPYRLAARIDHFAQRDLFDDYLVLVPVASPGVLFVTVSGRSDRLATGMFVAWRFVRGALERLWASDLLTRSSYEARPDGFRITYCAQPDEERPSVCRKMTRDTYQLQGAEWKRVEQADVPMPSR
jgi:hypothetical protein